MFTPFRLRGLTLRNRVVVSPMDMYSAQDGVPGDFHLVHLGARALGGAGLIMTEMVCVSEQGRITPGCAGLYTPGQADAWRRVTDFVHDLSLIHVYKRQSPSSGGSSRPPRPAPPAAGSTSSNSTAPTDICCPASCPR